MALVHDSRWRSLDSSGNPISGATLTVYTAGTTTPAAIWRDAALSVAMSNPTTGADKADSAGRFPQVFAASGALFDILEKDAAGVTIASYLSVPSLGTASSTLALDFTTSRTQFRGAGGTSYWEFGDASGDDVGGTGVIGGWAGTQADSVTVNSALVNVVGRVKENGYKIPGIVRQEAVVFTTVASVAIPLTNEPTGVRMYEIDLIDLVLSANTNLLVTFSIDGGATYIATATYTWSINAAYLAVNVPTGNGGDVAAHIADAVSDTALIRLSLTTPNSGAGRVHMLGRSETFITAAQRAASTFAANLLVTARVTHLKLAASTGTISGVYRVVPIRGLGET